LIRRVVIPRWIWSNAVLYLGGSDPTRYNTAADLIRRGIIPPWILHAHKLHADMQTSVPRITSWLILYHADSASKSNNSANIRKKSKLLKSRDPG
jgi:hypothetical protein